MKARLFQLSPLLMGLLLLPGCGDILKQNAVLTGGCTSAYRSQSLNINQVTNVTCSGTAATSPTATTYPTTGTGYPATTGTPYPATAGYPAATTQPVQGGQAMATPNGYAYQNSQTQANPYAGAVFPSGSYGTGYGSSNPYGSYPANPSTPAGYGNAYGTGTNTAATYGTGTYGTSTQAGYGTAYGTGTNTAATYGTGTYGTTPQAGYGTTTQTGYGTYSAPRSAAQTAAQGTGYIQYNVNQAQQNQAKR